MATTLYARDNTGKIKQWKIEVRQLNTGVVLLITTHGQYKGNQTEQEIKIEGKNIGRSNETSPYEQAQKEMLAKIEFQRSRNGYYTIEDLGYTQRTMITTSNLYERDGSYFTLDQVLQDLPQAGETYDDYSLPMKCQNFWKETKTKGVICGIEFPCIGQPKLNGVRCTLSLYKGRLQLMSKRGVEYTVPNHITEELWKVKELFSNYHYISDVYETTVHDIVIDGELYCHNAPLNEILSRARTKSLLSTTIKFVAFDLAIPNVSQPNRLRMLKRWYDDAQEIIGKPIHSSYYLNGKRISDQAHAIEYGDACIAEGYEGAVFRSFNNIYKPGKRVSTMVKYKKRMSGEFTIVDVIDSRNAPGIAIFVCVNDCNTETFKVNPEGTHDTKRKYFADKAKLIGKELTVEFYERTTDKQIPFHAVGIAVRNYE